MHQGDGRLRILWILALLMVIPLALGIEECAPAMQPSEIPCRVTSTWNYPNACNAYEAILYNDSGSNIQNYTLSDLGIYCRWNFNQTELGTYYYNITSGEQGSILVYNDKMWLIAILLIPLGMAFLFIYWANSLNEDQEPLKWFMRLLSLFMLFLLYTGADIVIKDNPQYSELAMIFNLTLVTWIFYLVMAAFLSFFIYKIFMSFHWKKKKDYEDGILR